MKILTLKVAESLRLLPQAEDKYLDFKSAAYKDFDCYFKDGLVHFIDKKNKRHYCTSIANIRQMEVEYELHNHSNNRRNDKKNKPTADNQSEVTGVPQTE